MRLVAQMTIRLISRGLPSLAALLLGVLLFEFIQAVVVDSLGGPQGLTAILESLPPALQAFTRTQPEFMAMSGLAGYLSIGFTHPLYLILTATAIVGFSCRTLAGEMERGTILLSLSRPISRPRLYASRVAGLALICVVLAVASTVGLLTGLLYARPEGEFVYRHLVPTTVACGALFWSIGGLTLLGSAAASTNGRALAWAIAVLVVSYFVDYFAAIWTLLESIRFLSIYQYFDPASTLVLGQMPWRDLGILAAAGAVATFGGLVIFTQRDLPT